MEESALGILPNPNPAVNMWILLTSELSYIAKGLTKTIYFESFCLQAVQYKW